MCVVSVASLTVDLLLHHRCNHYNLLAHRQTSLLLPPPPPRLPFAAGSGSWGGFDPLQGSKQGHTGSAQQVGSGFRV